MVGFLDNCDFNATSTGTGNFVVTTAVTGHQTPVNAGAVDGEVYRYYARSSDLSQWEEGFGAYTVSSTTLARTTIISNSSAGTSAISFSTVPLVAIVAGKRDLAALNDLKNVTFAVTAGSSALTIALKDGSGNDATAASPIPILFRNASLTASPNTSSILEVTGATSLVISSGSTMGVTTSTAFRLWIVGFNDGGTFRLGAINCTTSTQVFPLNEYTLASSTAEGGAGAADSAGVIYTGTAVTSKAFRILGFVDWTATGLTAGTWTTTQLNSIVTFGTGIKKPGDLIQYVYATTTSKTTLTNSTTQTQTVSTVSITPTSAANPVRARASGILSQANAAGGGGAIAQLSRGTSPTLIGSVASQYSGANISNSLCTLLAFDLPNTASAQAYYVYIKCGAASGTTTVWNNDNTGTGTAIIEAEEIMG